MTLLIVYMQIISNFSNYVEFLFSIKLRITELYYDFDFLKFNFELIKCPFLKLNKFGPYFFFLN